MVNPIMVDFSDFDGRVLSGRARGVSARALKHVDDLDASDSHIRVQIDVKFWSVTSSFFLGMFGPSIIKFGSKAGFLDKYSFVAKDSILKLIDGYIDFALQQRNILED